VTPSLDGFWLQTLHCLTPYLAGVGAFRVEDIGDNQPPTVLFTAAATSRNFPPLIAAREPGQGVGPAHIGELTRAR